MLEITLRRFFPDYPVCCFSNGQAFVDQLSRLRKPRLILLNQYMPALDGYQTLLHIRRQAYYVTVPIVMMSAHAPIQEIDGCYEAGANSFLVKGIGGVNSQATLELVLRYWLKLNQ
ncbi:response regulator [Fibrella sp. HMF5405]|uniref:Response regulator n=1 Tax=Fibrella forsythiae TaxID=2817061 RepID=A0ABS3JU76_9BACT|nr:response regulator [Fibrella forsythiae]